METRVAAAWMIVGALLVGGMWFWGRALLVWMRLRGDRVVKCPEDGQSALVHVDVALAIADDEGAAPAPLESCSRWAERGDCSQPCAQAAQAPASSPAAIVRAWAKGRTCVACGGALVESRFAGHHIALLDPSGMTREWVDVAADRLPLALATSLPICWNCHIAETFRRTHPDLVTDRDDSTVHIKQP